MRRSPAIRQAASDRNLGQPARRWKVANMNRIHAALFVGALVSSLSTGPAVMAEATCATANATVPPGANIADPSAPFFIDTAGLNLSTRPPIRDPSNPSYPPATWLADGQLPSKVAEGNFVIGPTHNAASETIARADVPKGSVDTFTISSNDSVIFNPGMIRDEPQGCLDAGVYTAQSYPRDPSNLGDYALLYRHGGGRIVPDRTGEPRWPARSSPPSQSPR